MTDDSRYVIPPAPQATIAVAGSGKSFPVRRIWCVGRNYIEHIREMGQDERAPPFFFAKPADAIVPDGGTVPYPSLTKDMHHEVELVVALKSGGRNIPADRIYLSADTPVADAGKHMRCTACRGKKILTRPESMRKARKGIER